MKVQVEPYKLGKHYRNLGDMNVYLCYEKWIFRYLHLKMFLVIRRLSTQYIT